MNEPDPRLPRDVDSGWSTTSLSLIVPAFNEEARLLRTLDTIAAWATPWGAPLEVLVVDDGSTDGTAALANAHPMVFEPGIAGPRLRVLRLAENRGKGAAVAAGVAEARGDFLIFCDADLSTPLSFCRDVVEALTLGADLAIGTRHTANSRVEVGRPPHRELMSRVFNLLARRMVGVAVSDVLCGFKGFRREAARTLFAELETPGFAFDVEILGLAKRHGLSLVEIPIAWRHEAGSTVRPLAHSFTSLRELFAIAMRLRK